MNEKTGTRTYEWSNPIEIPGEARTKSGFDFLTEILDGKIPRPPLMDTLENFPISIEKGKVSMGFLPQEYHYNPIGSVHGGVISTVLDSVMGCTVHSALPEGIAYTSLELKINSTPKHSNHGGFCTEEHRSYSPKPSEVMPVHW